MARLPKINRKWHIMGVEIGRASGWDQQDTFAVIIYDFIPNEVGKKFVPGYEQQIKSLEHHDLCIDWDTGHVAVFTDDGQEFQLAADWSVFNKTRAKLASENAKAAQDHTKFMKEHAARG